MDRYALAIEYHKKGYNCAQCVLAACQDLTGFSLRDGLAVAGGFGRGIASGEELCGAVNGAVMAMSLLAPHTDEDDPWEKQRIYTLTKRLQAKFREKFGNLRCKALLDAGLDIDERFPNALRLGLTKPCEVFIITAVELVEEMKDQIPRR